ncbi:zinc ribbon domain-containing protein [Granulicella paludicola]|uniref:zinc ribbon domain-containing protein n=1 Tax=Granulicella paludicola TaxID=474951 RepID=UPI0021DF963A|nr:zinc ribbon domain-containing protein [Granulicella paludicola]
MAVSKGLRLSERWFQRGLWLIAIIFAGFLIGLGRLVVGDLPKVEKPISAESFMDPVPLHDARLRLGNDEDALKQNDDALNTAELNTQHAAEATQTEQGSFDNWVATRSATEQSSQNPELVRRTKRLDEVKAAERSLQQKQDALESAHLQLQQARDADQAAEQRVEAAGQVGYEREVRRNELHVFLLRLAITLPLLLLAGLLFVKARKSSQWPFVWGFIFFALFTFFVELVPYLPSYGGYVRYIVGIVLTLAVGNYAIRALRRYLEKQKAEELKPEQERRKDLSYDMAQLRLSKRACPGCERPLDLADPTSNVCVHCGLLVFDTCQQCGTRQTVFTHFCRMCGLAKAARPQASQTTL